MGMGLRGVQGEQGVLPGDLCEFQGEKSHGNGVQGGSGGPSSRGKITQEGGSGVFFGTKSHPL